MCNGIEVRKNDEPIVNKSPISGEDLGQSQGSVHLDAIRGGAALVVFVNHTHWVYFSPRSNTASVIAQRAWMGMPNGIPRIAQEAVIVFFVLSGYLVGGSVLRQVRNARWSWSLYLSKRLTRLLVVFIPALVIGLSIDYLGKHFGGSNIYSLWAGPTADLDNRLGWAVAWKNLLFTQTILGQPAGTNASLWSLSCEFWYYIAFPFGVLALSSRSTSATRLWSALAFCIVCIFIGTKVAILFPLWILGALVTLLPWKLTVAQSRKLSLIFALALIAAILGARFLLPTILWAWYLVAPLSACLIFAVSHNTSPSKRNLYRQATGYFSRISYSLYLFHLPMAVFVYGVLNNPWHRWATTPAHVVMWFLSDVVILAVITGLWFAFEFQTDKVRSQLSQFSAKIKATMRNARMQPRLIPKA